MVPPFDIFRKQNGGRLRWLEVVSGLEVAKLRVKELADSEPGEYFIFSLEEGRLLEFEPDEMCSSGESGAVAEIHSPS